MFRDIAPHHPLDVPIRSQNIWKVAVSEFVVRLVWFALKHDRLGLDIDIPTDEVAEWNFWIEVELGFFGWPISDDGETYAWEAFVAVPEPFAGEKEYFS